MNRYVIRPMLWILMLLWCPFELIYVWLRYELSPVAYWLIGLHEYTYIVQKAPIISKVILYTSLYCIWYLFTFAHMSYNAMMFFFIVGLVLIILTVKRIIKLYYNY